MERDFLMTAKWSKSRCIPLADAGGGDARPSYPGVRRFAR